MKRVIRRKLKDARLLALLDGIVDSAENGVPIGNYLSQFFANLYLSELDHVIKEEMGIRYYYRLRMILSCWTGIKGNSTEPSCLSTTT